MRHRATRPTLSLRTHPHPKESDIFAKPTMTEKWMFVDADPGADADPAAGVGAPTTVLLAHHEPMLRDLLRELVESEPGYRLAGVAGDSVEAAELARVSPPDVVLLAGDLPGQGTARTVRALKDIHPASVVVVHDTAVAAQVLDALHAGARGYVTTQESSGEVLAAIEAAGRGEVRVPVELHSAILAGALDRLATVISFARNVWSLSAREREVLALIAGGASTRSIAQQLHISSETARTHIHRILAKLDVHSRLEAATMVQASGLADVLAGGPHGGAGNNPPAR